jgi:protoporphyrinogen oxidase
MSSSTPRTLILGAGLAGLSAAYHLRSPYEIFEARAEAGGVAGSFSVDGFTFDHAIHVLFTKDPYASTLIKELLRDNFVELHRSSWIYSQHTYTPYPYQAHNFGLPPEIIRENILGLIEARYQLPAREIRNFEDWILANFGSGFAKNFLIPFNRKVWATEPSTMSHDWISDRVMMPDFDQIFTGAFQQTDREFGPNAKFWYPLQGGTSELPKALAKRVKPIQTNMRFHQLDPSTRVVTFQNGTTHSYDALITTLSLPRFLRSIIGLPNAIRELIPLLRSNRVLTLNLGINRENISDKHWIYFPDEQYRFHRISFPANFSRFLAPPGTSSIMIEFSESNERPLGRGSLTETTLRQLVEIGILRNTDEVLCSPMIEIDPAYIIYDHHRAWVCEQIQSYLESIGVISCGRFGEWKYQNMDQAILSGKRAAESVDRSTSAFIHMDELSSVVSQEI